MKKYFKKITTLFLAFTMMFCMSVTAYATDSSIAPVPKGLTDNRANQALATSDLSDFLETAAIGCAYNPTYQRFWSYGFIEATMIVDELGFKEKKIQRLRATNNQWGTYLYYGDDIEYDVDYCEYGHYHYDENAYGWYRFYAEMYVYNFSIFNYVNKTLPYASEQFRVE